LNRYREEDVDDIIKALCHLTGKDYDAIFPLHKFVRDANHKEKEEAERRGEKVESIPMEWGRWYEWGFFRIKGFKKGTMHFEFLDENVWMDFNRRVAEIKGWRLPRETNKAKKERKRTSRGMQSCAICFT
jgi:hypothetical protein